MANTYETYIDSGIAWIGEIPSDWNFVDAKRLLQCKKTIAGIDADNYERLALTLNGVIRRSKDDNEGLQPEKFESYQVLDVNELVFKLIDLQNISTSRVGLSPYKGLVSPAYIVVKNKKNEDNKFYYYWYMNMYYTQVFNNIGGDGVRSALNAQDLLKLKIPDLSSHEQQSIATFLDSKCSEIDSLISLQEEMISELQAYKQSVITEAVTKGLNPNAKMKDSGVEWIGEIPQGWNIVKLNRILGFIGGYAFSSDKYANEATKNQVIRIGNVKNNELRLDASPVYINDTIAADASKCRLKKGYILFTMTGTKGKRDYFYTLLLKDENFIDKELYLNQRVGCFVPISKDIDVRYYNYLLKDNHILDSIFLYETGTANQGNLGIETINRTLLQFPSIDEQQQIATYLDHKTQQIDSLITLKQEKIQELKDYKKSIIYEYVTGKKRV